MGERIVGRRCGWALATRRWWIAAAVVVPVACFHPAVSPLNTSWRRSSTINERARPLHDGASSLPSVAVGPDESALSSSATDKKPQRRKRKNKYDTFSKVKPDKDPLEEMMEESNRKNQALVEAAEVERRQRGRPVPTAPAELAPQLAFPDTTTIDPYDPQTFGYIELGKVKGAHGVHGWVKLVASQTLAVGPRRERWFHSGDQPAAPTVRYLKPANKRAPRQILVLGGRPASGDDDYLLSIDGVEDRDAAELLRGAVLYARQEQVEEEDNTTTANSGGGAKEGAEPEEYAVADLVGLEVFLYETDRQAFVGKVGGVVFSDDIADFPGLSHDYLELILPRGVGGTFSLLRDELVLIPLVPQLVPVVNITQGIIEIDPPEGLLDLTYVREEKTRIKAFLPSSSSSPPSS
jgi:16S rRNA processing protein RimM